MAGKIQFFENGVLVEEWDDGTRTVTNHRDGTSRPYTEDENVEADERFRNQVTLSNLEERIRRIEEHL